MSVMKTSLMIIPMCPRERFSHIRTCPGLSFATKRIGSSCCNLFTFISCYPLRITLSQNYLLPIISVLAENTLLKTACHFLLLLVGSTLLLIERTTIDPLHLWVITPQHRRRPRVVGHPRAHATLRPQAPRGRQ